MNIALATLTLFILIYPGFLFRRFYYTGEFSKEYFKQNSADLLFSGIIPSVVLHSIGYGLFIQHYDGVNLSVIGTLLSGTADSVKITDSLSVIYNQFGIIVKYYIILCLLSAFLGFLFKVIVRHFKLDRKIKILRFQNEWHYVFSGEILDFPKMLGVADNIRFIYVDALVKTDEGTVIYTGILSDYVLSKEGGIDRIYLSDVKRRFLKDDKAAADRDIMQEGDTRYYQLPGEFLILPYTHIINIHITYYELDLTSDLRREIGQETID